MPLEAVISTYHVDLWEHASKLYRLYHWQQAADIFEFLAKDISDTRQRTKCLINKALIEARLGDHNQAVATVADAATLGEDLPIAAYLAGLLNCEVSELEFAEAWFEACLEELNGRDVDYTEDGLHFVLERRPVRHNLDSVREARMAEELGYKDATPDDLCYLPAELLFEAPPRSNTPSPTIEAAEDAEANNGIAADQTEPAVATPAEERPAVLNRVPSSAYSVASEPAESMAPLISDELVDLPEQISFEPSVPPASVPISPRRPNHVSIQIDPTKALGSPALSTPDTAVAKELRSLERIRRRYAAIPLGDQSPTSPKPKIPYTWHGRQQVQYEPRDARGTSDSVRELARFVQDFAPEGGPHEVRRLRNRETPDRTGEDSEDAGDLEAEMRRLGITSSRAQEAHTPVQQHGQRAQTVDANFDRPTLSRAGTAPVRMNSLRKAIWSPKTPKDTSHRHKPSKIRWPFQDDKDDDEEVGLLSQPARPPISAPIPAPAAALKPTPLDFIMGPDGKTIVIEKPPKTAPSRAWALERVSEARRSDGDPGFVEPGPLPPIPSSRAEEIAQSAVLQSPLLQPTVYEPPAWRRRQQAAQAATSDASTARSTVAAYAPHSPVAQSSLMPVPLNIPSRPRPHEGFPHQLLAPSATTDFTSPRPAPSPTYGNPQTNVLPTTPYSPAGGRNSGRRSIPSIVSSVNMWDYLLDKMKKDRTP